MYRTRTRVLLVYIFFFPACISACFAKDFGKVTSQKVAEGVYLFTTTPYGDAGLSGNSVAIVSDEGVLVFDANGTPETAATVLAEIRKLTDKPVRYLVNSHWHWDHWGGNQVYLAAFPGLQIITHEKTRELMLTVEPRWNEKGLKEDLPQFLDGFEKQIAAAKAKNVPPERIKAAEERLAADRNFLAQKQALRKTYPNVTFSDSLTLILGGREIQVLHARAITPGDTYLYLPKEKVLVTGDILLSPYPFAIGGTYPAEWLKTLGKLAALGPGGDHSRPRRCGDKQRFPSQQHCAFSGCDPAGKRRQSEGHDPGPDRGGAGEAKF